MPGDRKHHTDKWRSCVEKVMAQGHDESSASAICTASLQKAGESIFEGAESRSAEELDGLRVLWPRADGSDDHGRGEGGGDDTPGNKEGGKDPSVLPGYGNVVATGRVLRDSDPPEKVLDSYKSNTRGLAHAIANGEREAHVHRLATAVHQKQGYESPAKALSAARAFIKGGKSRSAESRSLHLLGATGLARAVLEAGREWLVVPVVALMEGVIHAVNALTPEFVPLATLQRAAASWNGKPITLGHPKRDGKQCSADDPDIVEAHGIGVIKNSRVEGTKLLQEAWIDKARTQKLHPDLYARLAAHQTEEVSVGAFVVTDGQASTHNGREFKASWTEATGDHLAFLPGGRGACSVGMGCGTNRAAMHFVAAEALEVIPDVSLEATLAVLERWLAKYEECETCDGTGQVKGDDGKQKDCPTCKGEGKLRAAAGARHSASDTKMIQTMHDHAVKLGAACDRGNYETAEEKPKRAINYEGGKYVLYSLDNRRKLAEHSTLKDAEAHDLAIQLALGERKAS